jgi:murein DD-endopeptidase MepM/ murein hydrolase activator NlpD
MTLFRRALVLVAFALAALPAAAHDGEVYEIVFPVAGPNYYRDDFGECRSGCTRRHLGIDIMADKGIPVVAAADGQVVEVRGLNPDGTPVGNGHQWLIVDHGGWQTWYLHLNNDTYGTNDGLGLGIAPDIVAAYVAGGGRLAHPVRAGQLIGWVGDSGAEWAPPHLHFEIRVGPSKWEATAVNPYPSLQAASLPPTGLPGLWRGRFADDDGSVHEADIDRLAADGTTRGCNPPWNTKYCPTRLITRGEIAAFIRRALALPAADQVFYRDTAGSVFHHDINALTAAGIGFGCAPDRYCPDSPLLRDEMAELLVRAFAPADPERYANPGSEDFFVDDNGNRFEDSINRLFAAGVTKGCNPPQNDRFCPDRPLIRAEMASFFVRALTR